MATWGRASSDITYSRGS